MNLGAIAAESWREVDDMYPYLSPLLKRNAAGRYFAPDLFMASRPTSHPELVVFGDIAVPAHARYVSQDLIVASTGGAPATHYGGWGKDLPGEAPIEDLWPIFGPSGEYDTRLSPVGVRVGVHRMPSSSGAYDDDPDLWGALEPAIRAAQIARLGHL